MSQINIEKILDNSETMINSTQVDILKKYFPQCFDKNGHFISEKLNELISDSGTAFSKESYGLDWLGKSYARLLANERPLTLLAEDKDHNAKPENKDSKNLLIKGDNLEVLKHLKGAYSEAIKMIYIDPPYNTGSDGFVYQDDRKFTPEQLAELAGVDIEEAERILEFTQSKANSHSAWLTFMYPRLYIAHELLRDDGVICISINESEFAQLKILCDEVFGEVNFLSDVAIKMSHLSGVKMSHRNKNIPKIKESILIYSKKTDLIEINDEFVESTWEDSLDRYNGYIENFDSDNISNWKRITIRQAAINKGVDVQDEQEYLKFKVDNAEKIIRTATNDSLRNIKKEKKFSKVVSATGLDRLVYNGEEVLFASKFVREGKVYSYIGDIWSDIGINNLHNEGGVPFKNGKKPLKLLQRLIRMFTDSNSLILDFFAGSGTTGHAVYLQNSIDLGERSFICVQINETVKNDKDNRDLWSFLEDANVDKTIFEATKARLIISGEEVSQSASQDYQGDLGFKIFQTIPIFDGYLDEMTNLQSENPSLFDGSTLSNEQLEHLLTTWKVYDGIPLTQDLHVVDLSGYESYRYDKTLYLMHQGFKTESLKDFLSKLDATDAEGKYFDIEKLVLFGYNFKSKHQLEINEAVRQYQNRKEKKVSVVVRY